MSIAKFIDKMQQRWRYRHLPQSHDIDQVAYRLAAEDSARYVVKHMKNTPNYDWDIDLLRSMCNQRQPGHVMEFGVASGRTIKQIGKFCSNQIVHGFDSFQGLPETWSWLFPAGSFAQRTPRVPKNVRLHVGWFEDTIEDWCKFNPGPIALLHIDCDLYSSTTTVLNALHPQLVSGTIIVFDEYLNHLGWEFDEFAAWQDYVKKYKIQYQYIGRVGCHQQVAVRIK